MFTTIGNMNNSPVRQILARAELRNSSSAIVDTWTEQDRLISLTIDRVGDETKFFGYGICQRLNIHLIDKERDIDCTTSQYLKIKFKEKSWSSYADTLPSYFVNQCYRDENTNELSITAYDRIYKAANYTVDVLALTAPYTLGQFAAACARLLGVQFSTSYKWNTEIDWSLSYEKGANFEGNENLRVALDALAEVTQSIYYLDEGDNLVFRVLDKSGPVDYTLQKKDYIQLENRENRRLGRITHTTSLGDNLHAGAAGGTTQYLRDNPFWDTREDVETLINAAYNKIGLLTINQFDCSWRGDIRLEVGDKIGLIGKDNQEFTTFLLNDTISYNGAFQQHTQWNYSNSDAETESAPANLGEIIRQTYAKVDKVDGQIELVTKLKTEMEEELSQMRIEAEGINATVEKVVKDVNTQTGITNDAIASLAERVDASMTSEDVSIQIQQELSDGVEAVVTTTGYKFDANGLTISKSGTEMTTTITEDGMVVYRDDTAMLTANHIGVEAMNLHATTYLMIGTYSRFEDFDPERTGCFWMGVGGGTIVNGN